MTGYVDPFGGSSVQPAQVSYRAFSISTPTQLAWPTEQSEDYVARVMEITALAGGLSVTLPDARAVSPGYDFIFLNPGANTYTVLDNAGGTVCIVSPGQAQYALLTNSSTVQGSWRVIQFASLASAVQASSLTGPGVGVDGSVLYLSWPTQTFTSDYTVGPADRAKLLVWTGGVGTLNLSQANTAGIGNDYVCGVSNQGTGTLTVQCSGSDEVDGSSSISIQVGESCELYSGGVADWYTVGRGRSTQFNFTLLSKGVVSGSYTLTTTEAANVVQKYTGALTGNVTIVLPRTVQVYYVSNQTTGAFSLTFQTAGGGSTVVVPTGQNAVLFCDATNVINSSTTVSGISALSLQTGSVGSPSINFVGDPTTGFYSPGSNQVAVATNGAQRLLLTNTYAQTDQALGIGGAPTGGHQLHVKTPSAQALLEPSTNTNNALWRATNTGGTAYLGLDSSTGTGLTGSPYALALWHTGNYPIVLANANQVRMTITSAGQVGLGTSTPTTKLHVMGGLRVETTGGSWAAFGASATASSFMTFFRGGSASAAGYIGTDGGGIVSSGSGTGFGIRSDADLLFTAGGATEVGRATSGGLWQVGATASYGGARLTLHSSTAGAPSLSTNNTAGSGTRYHVAFYESGVERGSIVSNGATVSYNTTSDRRLKQNIVDLTDQGAVIDAMQPREFEFKAQPGVRVKGFIAQELQPVAPEAVTEGAEEQPWSVDYSKLVPLLVKEVQSLRARVAALESQP